MYNPSNIAVRLMMVLAPPMVFTAVMGYMFFRPTTPMSTLDWVWPALLWLIALVTLPNDLLVAFWAVRDWLAESWSKQRLLAIFLTCLTFSAIIAAQLTLVGAGFFAACTCAITNNK